MTDVYKSAERFGLTFQVTNNGIEIASIHAPNLLFNGLVSFISRHSEYGKYENDKIFFKNEYLEALVDTGGIDDLVDVLVDVLPIEQPKIILKSTGSIGRANFRIYPVFVDRTDPKKSQLAGCCFAIGNSLYRSPYYLLRLQRILSALDDHPTDDHHTLKWHHLMLLAEIKMLSEDESSKITLDAYLQSEDVVLVSEFGLHQVDRDNSLTVYPVVDRVKQEEMTKIWDKSRRIQPVVDIAKARKRTRLVFSDEAYQAAKILHERANHVSGVMRDRLIANPMIIWDGAPIEVLKCVFGDRVAGVTQEILLPDVDLESSGYDWLDGLSASRAEGGEPSRLSSRPRLKIDSNILESKGNLALKKFQVEIPRALKNSVELSTYQQEGVAWMQAIYTDRIYSGVLLADEMGLGKTLQVLTFVCWMREKSKNEDPNKKFSVLLVVPKSLYHNWSQEVDKFFERQSVGDTLILDSANMSHYRKGSYEVAPGKHALALDIESIHIDGLVILNRDLLIQYQFSLGQVPWDLLVFDEAQFIKDPATLGREAAFAMQSRFRIAMTGTPVENRLLDLWSIVDFVHAKDVLGSSQEFVTEYGNAKPKDPTALQRLKDALRYNQVSAGAIVVRRTKQSAGLSLPPVYVKVHECRLSQMQQAKVAELKDRVSRGVLGYMDALSYISIAYQHPMAFDESSVIITKGTDELLAASDKLKVTLDIVFDIKRRNEKVIIFTRFIRIAEIVSIVLHEKLGVDGFLFNGSLSKRSRDKVIEDFKGTDGFSYLIASPMVGGVGLNLTEANHIIHYGRWWNPALERQCDARVHRKGQEKDVFIHHLIAKDDVGLSFDEKLHKMHQEKAAIADGLFGNVGSDGKGEQEFANDLFVRSEINKVPKFEGMKGFDHLSPEKFQRFATELVASLLGGIAIHPPFVGDKGADGLVVKKNEVYLLQAKHTGQLRRAIAASGIRELLRAYGDYSDYLIGLVSQLKEIYLVTNGILSTEARLRAVESSVNVIDRDNLGRLSGDLIAMGIRSAQNCRIEQSFDAVLHRLDDMLKKSA